MKHWSVQDAKARFSELIETCLKDGPQIVTKRGADTAVLVPFKDWQKLKQAARPTLKELLLSPDNRGDLLIPERGNYRRRSSVLD